METNKTSKKVRCHLIVKATKLRWSRRIGLDASKFNLMRRTVKERKPPTGLGAQKCVNKQSSRLESWVMEAVYVLPIEERSKECSRSSNKVIKVLKY